MGAPSDETSFYRLVVQCVARCEIKLNKLIDRQDEKARDQKYLRTENRRLREKLSAARIYIKQLEKELEQK